MTSICFLLIGLSFVSAGTVHPALKKLIDANNTNASLSVIIIFTEPPSRQHLNALALNGTRIKQTYHLIPASAASLAGRDIAKIAQQPFVERIEPDYEVKSVLDTSVAHIGAPAVWQANSTGKGVAVAIVDTGIDNAHPALHVARAIDFTGEGSLDLNGHGTHVAGIVASRDAKYHGVAPDVSLWNVKVLHADGSGTSSEVIKGIQWAVDNGARIISLSLGASVVPCDGTDALSQAVDTAVSRGIAVTVAAGNTGPQAQTITSPGCAKQALTVGATDDADAVPSWSSRGPTADGRIKPNLLAPGVAITSTARGGGFTTFSGTSMATPHITGVAALLLEKNITLRPSELASLLQKTAVTLGLDQNTQGAGRVDAQAAFMLLTSLNTTNASQPTSNISRNVTNSTDTNSTKKIPPGLERKKKSPLFVNGIFERISMALTFRASTKSQTYIHLAEMRLAQAQAYAAMNDSQQAEEELQASSSFIEESKKTLAQAQKKGENVSEMESRIRELQNASIALKRALYITPEQATQGIERAQQEISNNKTKKSNAEDTKERENVKEKLTDNVEQKTEVITEGARPSEAKNEKSVSVEPSINTKETTVSRSSEAGSERSQSETRGKR